jgi:peptide/nickel transport system permease protein
MRSGAVRSVGQRILGGIAALIGTSFVAFLCFRAIPGDPAQLVAGEYSTPQGVQGIRQSMGLDKPLYVQYWKYVHGFLTGDWGFSWTLGEPVRQQLLERLPNSIELALASFILISVLAIPMALAATFGKHKRGYDAFLKAFAYTGLGTPPFLAGLFLLLLFTRWFHVLPGPTGQLSPGDTQPPPITHLVIPDAILEGRWTTAWHGTEHIILPMVALSLAPLATLVRILRANLVEVSREPFIQFVRSKGISERKAALDHALPNAILPTLTASGIVLGHLIGSAILVESVYQWPGVGALTVQSALRKDFALPEIFILLSAILYVVVNTVVDVLYGVIDPRVRVHPGSA